MGLVHTSPYHATVKHLRPVFVKQYPITKEREEAITDILSSLIDQQVVVRCLSPYNTPVNPVRKPGGGWRFTQDLRQMNDLIVLFSPIVPDVTSIVPSTPCTHKFFSVVDLCLAFFSVPVSEQMQPLFALHIRGCNIHGHVYHKVLLTHPRSLPMSSVTCCLYYNFLLGPACCNMWMIY